MSIAELAVESPYRIETHHGLSVVAFLPLVNTARWSDLQRVSSDVLRQLCVETASGFVVDLSALNAMGSALVALVIKLWKGAKEHDRRMIVVSSNGIVQDVLDIAGLSDVWTIVPTRDDALRAIGNRAIPAVPSADLRVIALLGWLGLGGAGLGLFNQVTGTTAPSPAPLMMQVCCAAIAVIAGVVATQRGRGLWRAAGLLQTVAAITVSLIGLWQAQ